VQGKPLNAEQRQKLREADEEKIRAVLDGEMPQAWRIEFEQELQRRRSQRSAVDTAKKMQSEISRYLITKGAPFVVGGRITQLRTGGVISDKTHNLDEVRRQGIEIEPLKGKLVVTEGRLGVPTTKIVDVPEEAPVPSGEVPA